MRHGAMHEHDLGYAKLFSHPRMMEDLITGFIHETWVAGLDFSTLEKVNPVHVTDDFRKRTHDLIWKIRWKDPERWLYLYLMLEAQSTVVEIMALRCDLYLKLLYQDLHASGKIPAGQKFPPALSIVLYNGKQRWNAARDVADLIEEPPPGLETYRPHARYLLVDKNHYQDNDLRAMPNVVAALFRLEKSQSLEDVRQVIRDLDGWLQQPEQEALRHTFANWLNRILA
ncbi:MAG: Rpn family recombination-promoting nuclease/putative transposase, partial [Magnetococcales bacterium]|nr:Rpn family recombination-promoting nuclease/putative transposase [Magnetococcales bacterium]